MASQMASHIIVTAYQMEFSIKIAVFGEKRRHNMASLQGNAQNAVSTTLPNTTNIAIVRLADAGDMPIIEIYEPYIFLIA